MPNIKSAAKRMRSDAKKQARNLDTLSELKGSSRKLMTATDFKNAEGLALEVISKYDRAVTRGIVPQRRADRKKSRIAHFLKKLKSQPAKS